MTEQLAIDGGTPVREKPLAYGRQWIEEDDIAAGYRTLLNELEEYNPELLDKERVLALTKCDLIDGKIESEIEPTLPEGIPHVFISSISGEGLKELKDMLWSALQS